MSKRKRYPVLYKGKETNFQHNGLGILKDLIKISVSEERNGNFQLEMIYPLHSVLYEQLENGNIIKCDASDTLKEQLFRIFNTKKVGNTVIVYARHISFDLFYDVVEKISLNGTNCRTALEAIFDNSNHSKHYRASSNLGNIANFNIEFSNCLEAIGGTKGSIIDTFGNGAEILRDNTDISILSNRGQDKNVLVSYGKNITSIQVEDDTTTLATRIFPFARFREEGKEEDTLITLTEKYVDSKYINEFPIPYVKFLDLSMKEIKTETELREATLKYIETSKCDIPKTNYKIDLVALANTTNYKNSKLQESIGLCDTVIVRDYRFNINKKIKVIKVKYNPITEQYDYIELGQAKTTLGDIINEGSQEMNNTTIIKPGGGGGGVPGWEEALQNAIDRVTSSITGSDGGYVRLFPSDNPAEIFILDNEDINQAKDTLRINKDGIGFSKTGVNGPFLTGWTIKGEFLADCITSGTFDGNLIRAGTILANALSVSAKTELRNGLVEETDFIVEIGRVISTIKSSTGENLVEGGNLSIKENRKFWRLDGVEEWLHSTAYMIINSKESEGFLWSNPININTLGTRQLSLSAHIRTENRTKGADIFVLGYDSYDSYNYIWDGPKLTWQTNENTIKTLENFEIPNNVNYLKIRIDNNGVNDGNVGSANNTGVEIFFVNLVTGSVAPTVATNDIKQTYSEIKQLADSINLKADKIQLEGLVSFKNLSSEGETLINAGNISTGTMKAINVDGCNFNGGNFRGTTSFYLEEGSYFSCDGNVYVRNFYVPKTHPNWAPGTVSSFSVECSAYFGELVSSNQGFRVGRDYVPYSSVGATWIVERLDIWTKNNSSGTPYLWLKAVGGQSFGVDLWLYTNQFSQKDTINPRNLVQDNIGLEAIKNIRHFPLQKLGGQPVYNPDLLPSSWVYEVGEEGQKTKNIASSSIIPNITLAIQQQQEQIESLKQENKDLKARLEKIEQLLNIKPLP